jgi:molybdopterin biosynthesis enzyme
MIRAYPRSSAASIAFDFPLRSSVPSGVNVFGPPGNPCSSVVSFALWISFVFLRVLCGKKA